MTISVLRILFAVMMMLVVVFPLLEGAAIETQQIDGNPNCSCTCSVPVCANTMNTVVPSIETVPFPTSTPTETTESPIETPEPTIINTVSIPAYRPTRFPTVLV